MSSIEGDLARAGLEDERLDLSESMAGMGEKYPDVSVTKTVVSGSPALRLVKAAEKMDLLVLGAHRHSPLRQIMHGSLAMTLLEHAHVPVAVVPLTTGP